MTAGGILACQEGLPGDVPVVTRRTGQKMEERESGFVHPYVGSSVSAVTSVFTSLVDDNVHIFLDIK